MSEWFENLTEEQVQTYAVVLSAAGIDYNIAGTGPRWTLQIGADEYARAREAIASYRLENKRSERKEKAATGAYQKTLAGFWGVLLLLATHVFISMTLEKGALFAGYGASAEAILSGQYYRAVTALMLHADSVHLAGNMLGVALFGTAVCSMAGWGVGWLIILLSGAAGNLLNAMFYQGGHLSVGASTAVFGAVGFLSTHQFLRRLRLPGRRIRAWIPLGSGLALLGILGAAPNVDLGAHLFGFGAGILSGLSYSFLKNRPASSPYQFAALLLAIGIQIVCWWTGVAAK